MHIPQYYEDMCKKSEAFFWDVLLKVEAKHDMISLKNEQGTYLGRILKGRFFLEMTS